MNIPAPIFPPALIAIPFVIATFVIALRARSPEGSHPGLIVGCLSLGLLTMAGSYPLLVNFGPVAALAAIVIGCMVMHLAMWLGRAPGDTVEEVEPLPPALDPDLLDLGDIDWGGFDQTRRNWTAAKIDA